MSLDVVQPTLFDGRFFDPLTPQLTRRLNDQLSGAEVRVVTEKSLVDQRCLYDNGAYIGKFQQITLSPKGSFNNGFGRSMYDLTLSCIFETYSAKISFGTEEVQDFEILGGPPLRCDNCARITPSDILEMLPMLYDDNPQFPRYRHRSPDDCSHL
jgi:hypothetical protein